jgi:predicted permease
MAGRGWWTGGEWRCESGDGEESWLLLLLRLLTGPLIIVCIQTTICTLDDITMNYQIYGGFFTETMPQFVSAF